MWASLDLSEGIAYYGKRSRKHAFTSDFGANYRSKFNNVRDSILRIKGNAANATARKKPASGRGR